MSEIFPYLVIVLGSVLALAILLLLWRQGARLGYEMRQKLMGKIFTCRKKSDKGNKTELFHQQANGIIAPITQEMWAYGLL